MNTARKGSSRELRTAAILESEGWTVGSRRHVAGPGDLLAVKDGERPRLIEVKATAGPYKTFGPRDRGALRAYAAERGLVAELAWWAPRARTHRIFDEAEWP